MATAALKTASATAAANKQTASIRSGNKPTKKSKQTAKKQHAAAKTKPATKAENILTLLRHPKGATIAGLMKATGWQAHSVRGFLSGTVKKKLGFDVISEKNDASERRYRIVEGSKA
jgi:hypothetical protein